MRRNAWLGLGFALVTGCSTIIHGPLQDVRVDSTPAGATATISATDSQRGTGYLDEKQVVTTPAVVKLRRDNTYRIDFEKSGFGTARAELVSHYDWFWGQVTCGLCEAVGDLPNIETAERAWPLQLLAAVLRNFAIIASAVVRIGAKQ